MWVFYDFTQQYMTVSSVVAGVLLAKSKAQNAGWIVITATGDDLRRPWVILNQVMAVLHARGWSPQPR